MDQFLLYTLLVIVVGGTILGMGTLLWSDYQNYQQSKEEEALKARENALREQFILQYGGEEKFYCDMHIAYKAAREAAEALSTYNWIKKSGSSTWGSAEKYLEEHRRKANFYYKKNPEFKLREYIQNNIHL